jgi:hypothetical protein
MRKIVYLFILLSLSTTLAFTQDNVVPKNRFGFKAGVNWSRIQSKMPDDKNFSDGQIGAVVGVFREIKLDERFDFQMELLFNSVGGKTDTGNIRLNYLSLPLLFKLHGKHFGVLAGPQVGVLISGKLKPDLMPAKDLSNSYKSADISGIVGVEYNFGKNNMWVISARYQIAITNILKDMPGNARKNYAVQGTVGFRFK